MTTSAITFDQMERQADRTLGITLWAKHAKNVVLGAGLMKVLHSFLLHLVGGLSADKLDALTKEQALELTKKLQELHAQLTTLIEMPGFSQLGSSLLFRSSVCGLEEATEDLADVIEDLVLSGNEEFQSLVSNCTAGLSSRHVVGSVGGM
jgi:hypothetical protein